MYINAAETKLPSMKQLRSKMSKRPCLIGVILLLVVLIGSAISTFMVFHYKKQGKIEYSIPLLYHELANL